MTDSTCSSPLKSPLSPPSEPTTPSRFPGFPSELSKKTQEAELNPEEVYRSIRKTTAEIQNYSFEGSSFESDGPGDARVEETRIEMASLRLLDSPLRQKVAGDAESVMSPMESSDRATMQRILGLFVVEDSGSRKDAMQLLNTLMHRALGRCLSIWCHAARTRTQQSVARCSVSGRRCCQLRVWLKRWRTMRI